MNLSKEQKDKYIAEYLELRKFFNNFEFEDFINFCDLIIYTRYKTGLSLLQKKNM